MALQIADRVKEISTTTGTGTITLAGAQTGYVTFASAITTGNTIYYCIQNQNVPSEWEVGLGTLVTSSTLDRTSVLSSSNSGSAVSFSAGTKDVFCTLAAEFTPGGDLSGTLVAPTIANNAVTLAKMADMATSSLIYRKTAGTGDPEINTLATVKTDLGLTGTNSGDQTITLTGDVTGSGTGSFATTLADKITAGGPTGSSSVVPVITYDAKGRLTTVTTATVTPAAIGAVATSATIDVAHGGTGGNSLTAYEIVTGGTTSTGSVQTIPLTGTSGLPLISLGAGQLPQFASLPYDYGALFGYNVSYLSTSSIQVGNGSCPDNQNAFRITNGSTQTVTTAGTTYLNGVESKTLSGTVQTTNTSAAVVGTSTFFTTEFGVLGMTGTISSSSTTVTGTTTHFLTEIAVNDLIGNATKGYFRVTAIASNTSLTIGSTPGSAFSSSLPNVIQQPIFQAGAQTVRRVATITDDTHLTTTSNAAASASGLIGTIGGWYLGDGSNNNFYHCWMNSNGYAMMSTQRTIPYGQGVNYGTARRLCAIVTDSSGAIINFMQNGTDRRETHLMVDNTTKNTRLLSAGAAVSFTTLQGNAIVPPTSSLMIISLLVTSTYNLYVRPANLPSTVPTSGPYVSGGAGAGNSAYSQQLCFSDGAQQIQYANTSASANSYIDVRGFVEFI